jgi:hypothetical protein
MNEGSAEALAFRCGESRAAQGAKCTETSPWEKENLTQAMLKSL